MCFIHASYDSRYLWASLPESLPGRFYFCNCLSQTARIHRVAPATLTASNCFNSRKQTEERES